MIGARTFLIVALTGALGSGCWRPAHAASNAPATESPKSTSASPPAEAVKRPVAVQAEVAPQAGCAIDAVERQLLQHLRERQAQLDERERAISDHEAVLGRIEAELAGRLQAAVADVQHLEERVAPALVEKRAHDQQKTEALMAAIATLPARKASAIISNAEPEVAATLLGQLGTEKSAAILSAMEPAAAAALVQRMIKRGANTESDAGAEPTAAAKNRSGREGRP